MNHELDFVLALTYNIAHPRLMGIAMTFRVWWLRDKRRSLQVAVAALAIAIVAFVVYVDTVPAVLAQAAVPDLPSIAAASKGDRVLVFTPHPDDETIAAGGYIAQSVANGAEVQIVLVTNGNKDGNGAVRYEEFKKATSLLGVPSNNLVFMGLPDDKLKLENPVELADLLKEQVANFQPNVVLFPSPFDHNPDHAAIGRAFSNVITNYGIQARCYDYIVHYKLMYPRPWALAPNLFLSPPSGLSKKHEFVQFPLSPQIEQTKRQAISCYRSQMTSPELRELLPSFIRKNELLMPCSINATKPQL